MNEPYFKYVKTFKKFSILGIKLFFSESHFKEDVSIDGKSKAVVEYKELDGVYYIWNIITYAKMDSLWVN